MPSVGESEAWLTTTAWRANAMLPITCRGFEAGKRPQGFWQVVEVKLDVGQPRLIFRALRDIVFDEERKIDMARSLLRVRVCVTETRQEVLIDYGEADAFLSHWSFPQPCLGPFLASKVRVSAWEHFAKQSQIQSRFCCQDWWQDRGWRPLSARSAVVLRRKMAGKSSSASARCLRGDFGVRASA